MAKEAIHLGVTDLLNKSSIDFDVLVDTLKKADMQNSSNHYNRQSKQTQMLGMQKDEFFRKLFNGMYTNKEFVLKRLREWGTHSGILQCLGC